MNARRLPGLLYAYRYAFGGCIAVFALTFALLLHWGIVCTDLSAWRHVKKLCSLHYHGEADGNLCKHLCELNDIHSPSCQSFHFGKEAVFLAMWHDTKLVFKKVHELDSNNQVYWRDTTHTKIYPSEVEFKAMIRYNVLTKFNLSISNSNLMRLGRLKPSYEEKDVTKRHNEMENLWPLLQDHEYLCSALYTDRDIFPQLLGSCGLYFVVEYIEPVVQTSLLFSTTDNLEEWGKQLKIAKSILKYLEELDNGFVETFHLCDIKLHHFGNIKGGNGMKYIDLDMVYPKSVINRIITQQSCFTDDQCDFFDCRARCNIKNRKCELVSNNNLQMVCEKIFLGWTQPNKIIVPGLLMTQYTPSSLALLLRQCANPGSEATKAREAASDEVRERLISVISEIEQEVDNDDTFL